MKYARNIYTYIYIYIYISANILHTFGRPLTVPSAPTDIGVAAFITQCCKQCAQTMHGLRITSQPRCKENANAKACCLNPEAAVVFTRVLAGHRRTWC